jgi:hypothetical protein
MGRDNLMSRVVMYRRAAGSVISVHRTTRKAFRSRAATAEPETELMFKILQQPVVGEGTRLEA